jgi:hypothetical protein
MLSALPESAAPQVKISYFRFFAITDFNNGSVGPAQRDEIGGEREP